MRVALSATTPFEAQVLPEHAIEKFRSFERSIYSQSNLIWDEHCTECAYPVCYSTCAYYTPRADMNCQRLERGIESLDQGGLKLRAVQFRKWGKLEAEGPVQIISAAAARKNASSDTIMQKLIPHVPVSHRAKVSLARRWNERPNAVVSDDVAAPHSEFVIEAWMRDEPSLQFTLTLVPKQRSTPGIFQRGFRLEAGYNQIKIPVAEISAIVDLSQPYLVQIEPLQEAPPQQIVFGVSDFVELHTESASKVFQSSPAKAEGKLPKVKCVVWDLDNTVWDGTLAEDGIDGLVLRQEVVAIMKELDRRGVLQSVASKNDEAAGLDALDHFKLRDYMLSPQIGWHPKSQSVKAIAEAIDIGIDTFVFIDDQPFERAEVSAALPQVQSFSDSDIGGLLQKQRFDLPATPEAAKRRLMYKDEGKRKTKFAVGDGDYLAFLLSCKIELTIISLTDQHIDRAFELSQRTNQLNFSGKRYLRSELEKLTSNSSFKTAQLLRCEDRFGDYGIIGLCIFDAEIAVIESFMMSCRVQRKCVEQAYFSFVAALFANMGHTDMRVAYKPTERNQASAKMLQDLGFQQTELDSSAEIFFTRPLREAFERANIVQIADHTSTPVIE